jgi:hypothetical protein
MSLRCIGFELKDADGTYAKNESSTTAPREDGVDVVVYPFRVIVVEDGTRTTQIVVPFDRIPYEGDVVELPDGMRVKIRHVISAAKEGLAGIVLAWPG